MEPVENYKILGVVSFIIGLFATSYMVWNGPRDNKKSISLHAVTAKKKIYFIYASSLIFATLLFYLFSFFWFIPSLQLSFIFTLLITVMVILLFLTALIPETGRGIKSHRLASYSYAFTMMLAVFFIMASPQVSMLARLFAGISGLWMAIVWYLYFFHAKKEKVANYYLFYQSSYILFFFMAILAATYI